MPFYFAHFAAKQGELFSYFFVFSSSLVETINIINGCEDVILVVQAVMQGPWDEARPSDSKGRPASSTL